MAATLYSSLISSARFHLNEATANFWTDAELLDYALRGTTDLWAAILDLHQEHFLTVDTSNVSLSASTATLTGVPADTFRVYAIEPADTTTSGSNRSVLFLPRDYNHPDMVNARTESAQDPTQSLVIYYAVVSAGAPAAAPTIYVAPQVSQAISSIRFVYIPTLGVSAYTTASSNPIPGESNNALIAWIVAYAMGKEGPQGQRIPDPGWLGVYATEKRSLMARLTPRQEQESEFVDDLFAVFWGN